jgi:hypothetical protein
LVLKECQEKIAAYLTQLAEDQAKQNHSTPRQLFQTWYDDVKIIFFTEQLLSAHLPQSGHRISRTDGGMITIETPLESLQLIYHVDIPNVTKPPLDYFLAYTQHMLGVYYILQHFMNMECEV